MKDPTLEEVILAAVNSGIARVQTAIPAIVQSYDAAKQSVSLKVGAYCGTAPKALLEDVPVMFPSGGGYRFVFPLSPGDEGKLIYDKCDSSAFRATGQQSEAPTLRLHGNQGSFHPCRESDPKTLPDVPTGAMVLGKTGVREIEINGNEILLDRDAQSFVALADLVSLNFDALQTALAAATIPFTPIPVAASKVKAL